jgi:flagellar biosynthesis/type III secretory pathway chaperone
LPEPATVVPIENNREALTAGHGAEYDILKQHLAWTEQEKESLKKDIVEQGVLRDMLEEKSSQIVFLENQLEERIKNFREAEIRSKEDMSRVNELQYTVFNIRKENQQLQEDNRTKAILIEKMGKELQAGQEQSSAHIALHNEKLAHEMEQVKDLEAKLSFSHRLLQKIQDEIGTSFEKQMILYTNEGKLNRDEHTNAHPKISAWIESPSEEEEFEHII